MPSKDTRFAWIDTETSGLGIFKRTDGSEYTDFSKHVIIEVAVQVTDGDLNPIDTFEAKIRMTPEQRANAEPKALEVNGWSEEAWADAVEGDYALWNRVRKMTDRCILAGQNIIDFDAPRVRHAMAVHKLRPFWDRRMLDTMTIGMMAMHYYDIRHPQTGRPTAGLEFVYDALGGPKLPAHRAMADVKRAQYVYKVAYEGFVRARVGLAVTEPPPAADGVDVLAPARASAQLLAEGFDGTGATAHRDES